MNLKEKRAKYRARYHKYKNTESYKKYRHTYYKKWYAKHGRIKTIDQIEANIEWRKKHPEGVIAIRKVYYAVKSGKLKKPALCSICKQQKKIIHGHHNDYSKPLDVIWVCHSCHKNIHWKIVND